MNAIRHTWVPIHAENPYGSRKCTTCGLREYKHSMPGWPNYYEYVRHHGNDESE